MGAGSTPSSAAEARKEGKRRRGATAGGSGRRHRNAGSVSLGDRERGAAAGGEARNRGAEAMAAKVAAMATHEEADMREGHQLLQMDLTTLVNARSERAPHAAEETRRWRGLEEV